MSGIDVVAFARALGLQVYTTDLPADVRATMFRGEFSGVAELHVNASDSRTTHLFTTAHAVSLYWRRGDRDDFGHIVKSRHLVTVNGDAESVAANRFAWALLGDIGAVHIP